LQIFQTQNIAMRKVFISSSCPRNEKSSWFSSTKNYLQSSRNYPWRYDNEEIREAV